MNALDSLLLAAWNRIGKACRQDRLRARKRSRRQHKGVLTRPMREWCIAIRASDTRISELADWIEPPYAVVKGDPHEHTAIISGSLISELVKPITIRWPGVTYEEAAKLCGREWKTIKNWIRKGVFAVDHFPEHRFGYKNKRGKGVEHWKGRPAGDRDGRGGFSGMNGSSEGGRPRVWTTSAIDPNNFTGRAPHPVWGSLWQYFWEDVPDDLELEVKRVPRFRMFRGELVYRGWDFLCPGRVDAKGERRPCGRRCTYLFWPRKVWTLGGGCEDDGEDGDGHEESGGHGFDVSLPEESSTLKLAGQWHPGSRDPIEANGPRSFACKECWQVRSACMANYNGWNEFITQISGGLLYGRDVPRPKDICPVKRKKKEYRWTKPRELRGKRGRSESLESGEAKSA